jgi:hypothetical protein
MNFIRAIECGRYSPAEVIQATCNIIAAAIYETKSLRSELRDVGSIPALKEPRRIAWRER